jgi:hypothetical protein
MDPAEKDHIIEALKKAGVRAPCPRCANPNFSLVDGYFKDPVQPDLKTFNLGGPSIPTIVTVCARCGFVSQHALGALGLLPRQPDEEPQK